MNNTVENEKQIYSAEDITLIFAGVGGLIASVIYTLKNVKHLKSECLGCDILEVENDNGCNPSKEEEEEERQISIV